MRRHSPTNSTTENSQRRSAQKSMVSSNSSEKCTYCHSKHNFGNFRQPGKEIMAVTVLPSRNMLNDYHMKYHSVSSGSALSQSMKYAETWLYGGGSLHSSKPAVRSTFLCFDEDCKRVRNNGNNSEDRGHCCHARGSSSNLRKQKNNCKICQHSDSGFGSVRNGFLTHDLLRRNTNELRNEYVDPYDLVRWSRLSGIRSATVAMRSKSCSPKTKRRQVTQIFNTRMPSPDVCPPQSGDDKKRRSILECDINPYELVKKDAELEDNLSLISEDDYSSNKASKKQRFSLREKFKTRFQENRTARSIFDNLKGVKREDKDKESSTIGVSIGGQRIRIFSDEKYDSDRNIDSDWVVDSIQDEPESITNEDVIVAEDAPKRPPRRKSLTSPENRAICNSIDDKRNNNNNNIIYNNINEDSGIIISNQNIRPKENNSICSPIHYPVTGSTSTPVSSAAICEVKSILKKPLYSSTGNNKIELSNGRQLSKMPCGDTNFYSSTFKQQRDEPCEPLRKIKKQVQFKGMPADENQEQSSRKQRIEDESGNQSIDNSDCIATTSSEVAVTCIHTTGTRLAENAVPLVVQEITILCSDDETLSSDRKGEKITNVHGNEPSSKTSSQLPLVLLSKARSESLVDCTDKCGAAHFSKIVLSSQTIVFASSGDASVNKDSKQEDSSRFDRDSLNNWEQSDEAMKDNRSGELSDENEYKNEPEKEIQETRQITLNGNNVSLSKISSFKDNSENVNATINFTNFASKPYLPPRQFFPLLNCENSLYCNYKRPVNINLKDINPLPTNVILLGENKFEVPSLTKTFLQNKAASNDLSKSVIKIAALPEDKEEILNQNCTIVTIAPKNVHHKSTDYDQSVDNDNNDDNDNENDNEMLRKTSVHINNEKIDDELNQTQLSDENKITINIACQNNEKTKHADKEQHKKNVNLDKKINYCVKAIDNDQCNMNTSLKTRSEHKLIDLFEMNHDLVKSTRQCAVPHICGVSNEDFGNVLPSIDDENSGREKRNSEIYNSAEEDSLEDICDNSKPDTCRVDFQENRSFIDCDEIYLRDLKYDMFKEIREIDTDTTEETDLKDVDEIKYDQNSKTEDDLHYMATEISEQLPEIDFTLNCEAPETDSEEPIYEEISETPPPLPLQPPPTKLYNAFSTRSIFEGASKYDILKYLAGAKERCIIPEESELFLNDESLESEPPELPNPNHSRLSSLDLSSRVSHISDSSEELVNLYITSGDSCSISSDKIYKTCAEIERNDSGVGSETSKCSRSKWQHLPINSLTEDLHICEDCDQTVEIQQSDSGVMYVPLVCSKCSKKRIERREIICEIVETEEKYGRDLRIILEEFYRPMLVAGLLTPEQLSSIFLNVEELLENNIILAEKLRDAYEIAIEQGDEDLLTVNIGQIFTDITSMLHAFESYCTKQGNAALLLSNLEKEKELLRIFLRVSQMENTVLRRMNLNSFLMVPVQRVTKYPLLLARLYKVTPEHHIHQREQLKDARHNIELHLEHINSLTKDISNTKLWRRISMMNGRRICSDIDDSLNFRLQRIVLDVLEWTHDDVRFAIEGRLFYAQPTDYNWRRSGRTIKVVPINAVLVTLGKPTDNYNPYVESVLPFPHNNGIRDASLLLMKEKNGRYSLLREPIFLDRCVVCFDSNFEDYFEVQEIPSKETFVFKADDNERTRQWYRQLQYHSQGLGCWRKRRNALANIMINGMQIRT